MAPPMLSRGRARLPARLAACLRNIPTTPYTTLTKQLRKRPTHISYPLIVGSGKATAYLFCTFEKATRASLVSEVRDVNVRYSIIAQSLR